MSRFRYVLTSSSNSGIGLDPFERQAEWLVEHCELDPSIKLERGNYSKAGGMSDMRSWIAWKVAPKDTQAVVDAITYDAFEQTIPFRDATLDEHDVEVFDTKAAATERLGEVCDNHFFSSLR